MKIIILLFTILLVSCEGSSSGESSEKTAEVGNPAGTINLTNLTDLGLYDNGSLMLRSDCF
jgi:ABC-type Fe3+-citrate transport system substrate-binding protein